MALYTSLVIYNTYNNFHTKDTLYIPGLLASVIVQDCIRVLKEAKSLEKIQSSYEKKEKIEGSKFVARK